MDEVIKKLNDFATKHTLVFNDEGECGFFRPCVGFMHGDNYVNYNPLKQPDYKIIEEFYDIRWEDIKPKDAYHKHDCVCVLIRNEDKNEALRQLADWVDKMEEIGVTVVKYETGATGIQALMTGVIGTAFKLKK